MKSSLGKFLPEDFERRLCNYGKYTVKCMVQSTMQMNAVYQTDILSNN